VPVSEIRRRFGVDGDEGSFIDAGNGHRVFVGLPLGTAQSLEKLWKQGKIGFEYSVEFDARVLIGVYPMNPSKEELNGHHHVHLNGHSPGRAAPSQHREQEAEPASS
jgi:hypothetical protein